MQLQCSLPACVSVLIEVHIAAAAAATDKRASEFVCAFAMQTALYTVSGWSLIAIDWTPIGEEIVGIPHDSIVSSKNRTFRSVDFVRLATRETLLLVLEKPKALFLNALDLPASERSCGQRIFELRQQPAKWALLEETKPSQNGGHANINWAA